MMADMTILFAEDDLGNFVLTKRYLRRWGIESRILRFSDGQQILDFLFDGSSSVDPATCLVILDVHMPNLDGIEVLKRIRLSAYLNNLPVMMLSTTDRQDTIDKCLQYLADYFFVKPLQQTEFFQALDELGIPTDSPDDSGIMRSQHVHC